MSQNFEKGWFEVCYTFFGYIFFHYFDIQRLELFIINYKYFSPVSVVSGKRSIPLMTTPHNTYERNIILFLIILVLIITNVLIASCVSCKSTTFLDRSYKQRVSRLVVMVCLYRTKCYYDLS